MLLLTRLPTNNTALVPLPQVGVAVHHYLLIGGGAREGSVSWNGGQVHIGHVTNTPVNYICCVILTPEGDVASSTHIRGSWVGLSEDH